MAKYLGNTFGRLMKIENNPFTSKEENERRLSHLNKEGMIVIYESGKKYPGKHFLGFYPNEEGTCQRYMLTTVGTIGWSEDYIWIDTSDGYFEFELSVDMSDEEKKVMEANFWTFILGFS